MAKTAKSAVQPLRGKERRVPRLREQVQVAYDTLRDLLGRAGYEGLLTQLKGLETVNDVLRHRPEVVPLLQTAAWELRHEKRFSPLFLGQEDGTVVESRDTPIAPCGRTFAQVGQAHLYGAARLYFERLELEFAARQARAAEKAWRKDMAKRRKSGLAGRLSSGLKELTSGPPRFDPEDYRAAYEGHGLYDVIKPHLNHDWQFRLIPVYARLGTRQAEALDDLLTYFTDPHDLETLVNLTPQDISQARGFARIYAETIHGLNGGRQRRQAGPEMQGEDQMALLAAIQSEERRIFDLLLTRYVDSLEPLRTAGASAETTVRRLAPIFREEVFPLFQDPSQLENAVNCPDFVLSVIGTAARACPPIVSQALTQIQDRALTKDLLTMAVETIPPKDLETYLSDPQRRSIWTGLPAKFNNTYKYQADAPSDSAFVRNAENLRMVADGIFDNLRNGRTEPPASA